MKRLILLLLLGGLAGLRGDDKPVWWTDYPAAVLEAKKENKMLLLEFNGKDWCPYCQLQVRDIFSTDPFKQFAKRFILVMIDFPRFHEQSPELKKQNNDLLERYHIEEIPTTIEVDPNSDKEINRLVGHNVNADLGELTNAFPN